MPASCHKIVILAVLAFAVSSGAAPPEFVRISKDRSSFVLGNSSSGFTPWGFNYDHDRDGRLIEDYWITDWDTVVSDFQEMKSLGANCVRVHFQVGRFMDSPDEPNQVALRQLKRLLTLAEQTKLYLNLTGLGCYHKQDVPQWFDELAEGPRWKAQARFWEAIAETCRNSPAVFCYDLMNEPVITEDKDGRNWTPGEPLGGKYFVQRLALKMNGRTQMQIAESWVAQMATAIRSHDSNRLITVGAIPWAMTWPNAKPLFYSPEVSKHLDFVSIHVYPKSGEIEKALKAIAVYDIGKPMVIEEMFPLSCSIAELDEFVQRSRTIADGWIGFYWGKTIEEYRREKRDLGGEFTLGWLEYFERKNGSPAAEKKEKAQ